MELPEVWIILVPEDLPMKLCQSLSREGVCGDDQEGCTRTWTGSGSASFRDMKWILSSTVSGHGMVPMLDRFKTWNGSDLGVFRNMEWIRSWTVSGHKLLFFFTSNASATDKSLPRGQALSETKWVRKTEK